MAPGLFQFNLSRGRCFLWRREIGQFQAQIAGIGGIGQSGFQIDDALANQSLDLAIEVLHSFRAANAHGIEQGFALALTPFNVFASALC
jgi:hypothetical protein